MRTPVLSLIRLPSRTILSVIFALLPLMAGGLGTRITEHRIITGSWPTPAATVLFAVGSAPVGSPVVLAVALPVVVFGLSVILLALWSGPPGCLGILPDDLPGQTVAKRCDLVDLIRPQAEQVGDARPVAMVIRHSRADALVPDVLGNPVPV